MKSFFRILVIVIVVGIFGFTIYYLYGKSKEAPIIYETTTAFVAPNIIKKTVATGSVNPRKEIDITPKVSGIIEELYVEPGEMVQQGDVIAKIKIIPNMVSLNNAESRLNRAEISLENAKRKFERRRDLYNDGVIPAAEFEQYELEFENATEELSSAQNNLELIQEGQTKAAGKTTNTLVRSTIKGMVLAVPVEQGNSVIESNTFNAGTTIATIADMNEMVFEGKIDETEVGKISEGMPLTLQIGAIEDIRFEAVLEHISPKGVEENGAIQFEIKADVKLRNDQFIRAGYSANADIVLARVDSVLAVPESVIQFDGDTAFVEVETEPQVFEKRDIELGLSDGLNIEVISGLSEEDKIKVPIR
ncbi:MAG: efflux RND transporter periplasmic adaptor subunit [Bacteroidales bacterium]|nr:efflux RND transporter periplasmic adaptor subunit [Bacteroidales bacterium]